LADNTIERTQAEAQFRKAQKQKEGAEAMAAYVVEADVLRAKTARLRELRLAKEAADKALKNKPVEKAKYPRLAGRDALFVSPPVQALYMRSALRPGLVGAIL
jgi:hypothetical protein